MADVRQSTIVDAPVAAVWRILRDFNGHESWHPAVAASTIEGGAPADGIGAVRAFRLASGAELREQLLSLSDRERSFSYCILEAPLPLMGYVATVRLKPVTDGDRTFWEWRSRFEPPATRRDELVALVRDDIHRAGFAAIKRMFAGGRTEILSPSSSSLLLTNPRIARAENPPSVSGFALGASPPKNGVEDGRRQSWRPSSTSRSGGEAPIEREAEGGQRVYGTSAPMRDEARGGTVATETTPAILVRQYGGPDELRFTELPLPQPGPGEVRIRHTMIGVNFIDVYCRTGYFDLLTPPGVPGMEAAGIVEAVGASVRGLEPGDRVAYACPPVGAYALRRNMAPDLLVPLPADIGDETAAAGLLKGVTASFLLHEVHTVRHGQVVLIHAAAGGVGQLLVQWARAIGATVIATTSSDDKARLLQRLGADHVIVYTRESFSAAVQRLTGGRGADVVYDAVGKDSLEGSIAALAVRGHLISFGQASGPVGSWDLGRFSSKSITVSRPNYGHYTDTLEKLMPHVERFFAALRAGIVRVEPPTRYALADAASAHRDLEGRRTTGSLVLVP